MAVFSLCPHATFLLCLSTTACLPLLLRTPVPLVKGTSIMLHPHGHTLNLVFTSKLFYFGNLKPHDLRISDVLLTISYPYSSISPLLPLYLLSHPSRTSSHLFSWSLNAIAISLLYILNEKSDCPPFCPWELLHLNSGLQPHLQAISSIIYFLL